MAYVPEEQSTVIDASIDTTELLFVRSIVVRIMFPDYSIPPTDTTTNTATTEAKVAAWFQENQL